MTCSASCGSQREMVELLINKAITDALKSGDLQAGLKDCDGGALGRDSKVVLCNALVDSVNEAIKNGEITVIKDIEINGGKLVITDGTGAKSEKDLPGVKSVVFTEGKLIVTPLNGEKEETQLPYPKMAIGNKEVVLTNPNGEHVSVPKSDEVLTEDDFDKTIVKGANEPGKLGVKVKTRGGLEATDDGVGIKLGDGVKTDTNGALTIGEVFAEKPITGKGTKEEPLKVALNKRDFDVNEATGEVSLKAVRSQAVTDLNSGVQVMGYSTFFGNVDKAGNKYAIGVPPSIDTEDATQNATARIAELKDGEKYDFNGWQLSSPAQVDQYLVGTDKAVWHRVNDGGMNTDGTLKEPGSWSVWHRETNNSVSVVQLEALQKRVDNLEDRVAKLEALLASFVNLKDASGTEQLGLIKP